jgi:O-antigen ligase
LRASRTLAVRAILIAVLLTGTVATVSYVGGDRMARRLETVPFEFEPLTDDDSTTRQAIWRATWEMIKDHPVAGVGFGAYAIAIPKYHRASGEITPQEAHNDYLELLASGGVIALVICAWFVFNLVRSARDQLVTNPASEQAPFQRAAKLGALAGIFTVGVHSLVDFGLHIPSNAFVFTALISIILVKVDDGERPPD